MTARGRMIAAHQLAEDEERHRAVVAAGRGSGVVVLAAVAGLVGCVGAPPCASDSCVAAEPQEDAFVIRLTGLDEERGCWGQVSYLNVPWEYVRSVPTNERTGCLFDLRTQQAYRTPQFGYDLDYEAIGWHSCDLEHGYASGADGVPLCTSP